MTPIRFITGILTFYLKGEINRDANFIYFKLPNTVLGFIPLGRYNEQIMVNQIASTSTSFRLVFKTLIAGLIETFLGFVLFGNPLLGIILLLLGASTIISAFQTTVTLNLNSGEQLTVYFIIFEKKKAYQAMNMINEAIYCRMNDTNTRRVAEWQTDRFQDISDRQADRIVGAINGMQR